jgi:RNA polymerase sigma factor (TIGR02999 family)
MIEHGIKGVTQLINRCNNGEYQALDELVTLVYNELARQAHRLMQRERPGHMLQTSALVHEAYLRLIELGKIHWQGRRHFFAVTAGVMRRILVDQARAQCAYKRGGNAQRVTFNESQLVQYSQQETVDMLALDEALNKLSNRDGLQAKVVELRYFAGISVEETAKTLGISTATVKRKWVLARSQLYRDLHPMAV